MVDHNGETLPGVFIDHVQHLDLTAIDIPLELKIHGPQHIRAVEEGVSANFLDALARHVDNSESPEDEYSSQSVVEMSLQLARDEQPSRDLITVPTGLTPVFQAAHSYLRGEAETIVIRVVGLVTKLERRKESGPGAVVVTGTFADWDLKHRNIRIPMDEGTYRSAIHAHENGITVDISVEAIRERRSLDVKRMISYSERDSADDDANQDAVFLQQAEGEGDQMRLGL